MSTSSNCWELLYRLEENNIDKKQDVIILMVHLILIKNDFLCIHDDGEGNAVKTSELLPNGWNSIASSNTHKLYYSHQGTKFYLSATLVDGVFAINLLDLGTKTTHAVVIPEDEVKELHGSLTTMVPNNSELFSKIWTELVNPVTCQGQSLPVHATLRQERQEQSQPQRSTEEMRSPRDWPRPNVDPFHTEFDPSSVGSRDLNPFAPIGQGGGMLLENPRGRVPGPMRDFPVPGMLPRGSIPPGARFDPINPMHPGRRVGPDPDHLPMPGRFDDMFM